MIFRQLFDSTSGTYTYLLTAKSDGGGNPFRATDKLLKEDEVAVIQGCFVYSTFGASRHSIFCFYYRKNAVYYANLAYCPVGQYTD